MVIILAYIHTVHWSQVFDVIPDISNSIEQTSRQWYGRSYNLSLFILNTKLIGGQQRCWTIIYTHGQENIWNHVTFNLQNPKNYLQETFWVVVTNMPIWWSFVRFFTKEHKEMDVCICLYSYLGLANECTIIQNIFWIMAMVDGVVTWTFLCSSDLVLCAFCLNQVVHVSCFLCNFSVPCWSVFLASALCDSSKHLLVMCRCFCALLHAAGTFQNTLYVFKLVLSSYCQHIFE